MMNKTSNTGKWQARMLAAFAILASASAVMLQQKTTISHPEQIHNSPADMDQQPLCSTGDDTDVAIQGPGFFRVKVSDALGDGTAYTRNGEFQIGSQGQIVGGTDIEYTLVPPITVPLGITKLNISVDGFITGTKPGNAAPIAIGRFHLVQFADPHNLRRIAHRLYQQTESSGTPLICEPGDRGAGQLLQSRLEMDNANTVTTGHAQSQMTDGQSHG
jgi:flagellar basal-body rod protein FlgG